MAWLFVPGLEDLNSDSISPSPPIEPSVTLSGKPTPRPLSWRGWQTRPWIRLLCGTTCSPSTASRGVESWILSLRATRASRSQAQVGGRGKQTSATSGPRLPELSERFPHSMYSSRTLPEQLTLDMDTSSNSRAWATELRRDYSLRRKWAHRTRGPGFSSWPKSPSASDAETGRLAQYSVTQQAAQWRTPKADTEKQSPEQKDSYGAANWPTATAGDVKASRAKGYTTGHDGTTLTDATRGWPTPPVPTGGSQTERTDPGGGLRRDDLLPQIAFRFSLPAPQTSEPGEESSPLDRKLNPLFVEWLMGWPIGMTDCDSAVTEWSLLLQRWRSLLFGDG